MREQEGVIKFSLEFTPAPPLPEEDLRELGAWRRILWLLGLTGRDPARYGGLGYGNVSRRLPAADGAPTARPFVISGTQTGGLPWLGPEHYALVRFCDPQRNRVVAEGPLRPSSEALTHGGLYALDPDLACVLHVHAPDLWQKSAALGLPVTDPAAAYGTPEISTEVARLYADPTARAAGLFAMGGHEDGLVAFGPTISAAGTTMVQWLARALV